jgi:hypothetical protein
VTLPAPYPADTRAKGWRFELDMERARQSDTWAIASPEARPWLLMLWATAWEQTPCGSLPDDDELIAARIGMPPKLFAKHRAILLRKWWLADDGRLYHAVLVQRVLEMMKTRRSESDRKAAARAREASRMSDGVTQESGAVPVMSHGTTTGLHPESGTGTGTGTKEKTKTPQPPEKSGGDDPAGFAEFWNSWPTSARKQDRKKCAEKWRRSKFGANLPAIVAHVEAAKQSKQWRDGFEPAPLTYLNGERWADGAPVEADSEVGYV